MREKISVVGLGKLGICSAVCFASRGFKVLGVDLDPKVIRALNRGRPVAFEPGLKDLIWSNRRRLEGTHDFSRAIAETDVTFIIVPSPSLPDGNFSSRYVRQALKQLAVALKENLKNYHLFVVVSTVTPGTAQKELIPLIEKYSGRKLGQGFGYCYNPEFIALGSVVRDFLHPDLVLVGSSDDHAQKILRHIYRRVCLNKPYFAAMSIVSSEITKVSLNSYVTMKISFANTLANICESIPGADLDAITRALGQDRRVSPFYLKGGLSYGGPCFPRDNRAFAAFAGKLGVNARLAKATDEVNEFQIRRLSGYLLRLLARRRLKTVGILGAAYKPNTPVIEESPSIKLAASLLKKGIRLVIYDSVAESNLRRHFRNKISYAKDPKELFSRCAVVVLASASGEYNAIDRTYLKHNPTLILDCWRMLDPDKLGPRAIYLPLGRFNRQP